MLHSSQWTILSTNVAVSVQWYMTRIYMWTKYKMLPFTSSKPCRQHWWIQRREGTIEPCPLPATCTGQIQPCSFLTKNVDITGNTANDCRNAFSFTPNSGFAAPNYRLTPPYMPRQPPLFPASRSASVCLCRHLRQWCWWYHMSGIQQQQQQTSSSGSASASGERISVSSWQCLSTSELDDATSFIHHVHLRHSTHCTTYSWHPHQYFYVT